MVNRYSVKRNNILKSRSNKKIKKGYSNHRKCTVGIRQKKGEVSMVEKNTKKLNSSFEENIRYMNEILPVKESFDIIRREIIIGGKASVFYYIDGFIKDEAMLKIMDSFLSVSEQDMPKDAEMFIQKHVPYVEVEILEDFDQVIRNVLSGPACLFIDGYKECIALDCRTYPARGVDEPDKDKSLRGSRDGFVETIVFNTALMRRRIRDPHLVMEMTEAMILPTSIFDMIEEANDYYFPTVTGMYLKITRTLITVATVFFTPLYLLFMQNIEWLPEVFRFVEVQDTVNIPLVFQFIILELSIDGLRLAAMNTPTMLSTPLSVIAGIVMGEFSVQSGWFNSEVMLYMAFVAVANYTQPNFELGYALKFMRLLLLVLTACFNLYGFIIGCILVFCFLVFNKTLSGRNYMNVKLN